MPGRACCGDPDQAVLQDYRPAWDDPSALYLANATEVDGLKIVGKLIQTAFDTARSCISSCTYLA